MKKFKSLFVVAAAVLIGFSSCMTSDIDPGEVYHDGNVRLQIVFADTRVVGPSQTASPVAITSGTVIFTTGTGVIQHVFPIGQDGVTMDALAGGHTFANVSALASQVHFIGNTTISANLVLGSTNISAVLNQVLDVPSQAGNLTGTHQVVNVYRMGLISGGTAHLEVEPTVARVELRRITGDRTIAGFTVQGIFMDRYFPTARLDGRLIPFQGNGQNGPLVRAWGSSVCVNLFNWPSAAPIGDIPAFTAELLGPVFDWATPNQWQAVNIGDPYEDMIAYPAGTPLGNRHRQSIEPTPSGYVWGYNLFAHYTTVERDPAAGGLGSQFPMVIVRMTNVMIRRANLDDVTGAHLGYDIILHPEHDGDPNRPLFVTIRGFVPTVGHGAGEPLCVNTGFFPRRVYQIGTTNGGWFSKDAVRQVPNEQPVNVEVTIVPMPWILIPGDPVV